MGVSCLQSFRGSSDQLPIPNWSPPIPPIPKDTRSRFLDTPANYPLNTFFRLPIQISSNFCLNCDIGKTRMSTTTRNWAINSHEHKSWLDVPSQHRREPKTAQFSGRLSCPARLGEYRCVGITTLFLLKMGVDGPILPTQSISITAVRPPPITLTLSP